MSDTTRDTTAEAIIKMHDARAESYSNEMMEEITKPMYSERIPRFVAACPDQGPLIDVGCGSGDCLALVHQRFPDIPLLGCDVSSEMVKIARHRVPSATITQSSGSALSEQPSSVRGILSYFVIHFLCADELATAAASWSTALCAGGRLLLGFWVGEPGSTMEFGEQWVHVQATYNSRAEVVLALTTAGLAIVRSEEEEDPDMCMMMGFIEAIKKD